MRHFTLFGRKSTGHHRCIVPVSFSSIIFFFSKRKTVVGKLIASQTIGNQHALNTFFSRGTNFHTFLSLGVSFSTSFKSEEIEKKSLFLFCVSCLIASGRKLDGHSSLTRRRHRLFAFLFYLEIAPRAHTTPPSSSFLPSSCRRPSALSLISRPSQKYLPRSAWLVCYCVCDTHSDR